MGVGSGFGGIGSPDEGFVVKKRNVESKKTKGAMARVFSPINFFAPDLL
jgi:hypothetical protein